MTDTYVVYCEPCDSFAEYFTWQEADSTMFLHNYHHHLSRQVAKIRVARGEA